MKEFSIVSVGFIDVNCYLVPSASDGCLYIIDPGSEPEKILGEIDKSKHKDFRILLTHGHVDHIGAVPELMKKLPVSKLYLHKDDLPLYKSPDNCLLPWIPLVKDLPEPSTNLDDLISSSRTRQVEDSGPASGIGTRPSILTPVSGMEGHACHDRLVSPDNCEFRIIHTPGHTRGAVCFLFEGLNALFSGDTIFQASVGRTDLPGGSHGSLMNSIRKNIFTLPDNLEIFPGHGPSTTVGFEKQNNPYVE